MFALRSAVVARDWRIVSMFACSRSRAFASYSRCASVVMKLVAAGIDVHCLRDLTRGGLASALVEIAEASKRHLHIESASIAVHDAVRGACEILGLDPLYVPNEGRFVAFVPEAEAAKALAVLREANAGARRIGVVGGKPAGLVTATSDIGATRIVDMLSGEQLPRIC